MSLELQQLRLGIAALEAQRGVLGDGMVDSLVAAARAKLATLSGDQASAGTRPGLGQTLRQVSILFLDVVDSTALSRSLDPEETGAVMDGALSRGTTIVKEHLGRVLQYAGDNLLAVFGADEASEDDTERAVRCGLALVELGRTIAAEVKEKYGHSGFDVRVGVHTGSVLLGGGVAEDGGIRGNAVNVAARMEQTAPAGGLRISHDSYAQVRGLFDVEAQEPFAVKGLDAPVRSYLVMKAKPRSFRIKTRGIEGVATRMIGRDAELEQLQAAFMRLYVEPRLAAVSVVADAGLGKSRLLTEFETWAEERPERFYIFRARASPQTQRQPFGLLRDIIAWRLQIADDDTVQAARSKIELGVMPLFASDEPDLAEGHAHLLGHLIGVDWKESPHLRNILEDPKQIRNRALHVAAQIFRRVSAGGADGIRAPIVLLLEDLHWADDDSLDFLEYLAEVDRDVPMLVLAFTRPTLFERRKSWKGAGRNLQSIDLDPLDARCSRDLANELLKRLPEVPPVLLELVTGGAAGNPFYMEELVKMLIDQGAIDTRVGEAGVDRWSLDANRLLATKIPTTLTGVLESRLDGLPADDRLTLQQASVIGQVFWDRALIALDARAEKTLPRLVERELTLPHADSVFDGLREYAFMHHLLHQVTYNTVLKRMRRDLHGKIARWLAEQVDANSLRSGDFLGIAAGHFEEAGADLEAAEFHARAAAHAAARFAHAAAHDHIDRALAILDRLGTQPESLPIRWRLLDVRERTFDLQGERESQAQVQSAMQQLADALHDPAKSAQVAYRRSTRAMRIGDWAACERGAREAIDSAGRVGDDELRLSSLRFVGLALARQGEWAAARLLLHEVMAEARALGLKRPLAHCLNSLTVIAGFEGEAFATLDLARQSLDLFREMGDRRTEALALGNVGEARLILGDFDAARRDMQESLRLMRANGDRGMEWGPLCNLSMLAHWQDDNALALALAQTGLETAAAAHARVGEAFAAVRIGHAEFGLDRRAEAAEAFERARAVARANRNPIQHNASAGLARVALARGDGQAALREVDALLLHDSGDGSFGGAEQAALIEWTCCFVLERAGDERAPRCLERAHATLQAKAAAIGDSSLRQLFLTNIPEHRQIVAMWEGRRARTGAMSEPR